MFVSFSGGIEHWATICGALVSPVALIGATVADKKIRSAMVNLMSYFCDHMVQRSQSQRLFENKKAEMRRVVRNRG